MLGFQKVGFEGGTRLAFITYVGGASRVVLLPNFGGDYLTMFTLPDLDGGDLFVIDRKATCSWTREGLFSTSIGYCTTDGHPIICRRDRISREEPRYDSYCASTPEEIIPNSLQTDGVNR